MTDHLSAAFAALADPTRRAILARLALGEASVGELAEPFDISLPAISRHLKVLEKARLIARERDAQWRRCRIEPEGLKAAADWVEQYRKFWEERLDALADFLDAKKQATIQESKGSRDDKQRNRGSRRRD